MLLSYAHVVLAVWTLIRNYEARGEQLMISREKGLACSRGGAPQPAVSDRLATPRCDVGNTS